MKLTEVIKNFKNNIVGYFNKEENSGDSADPNKLKVIGRINQADNYYFVVNPREGWDSEFPEDSICFIKNTTTSTRYINISQDISKPFKFIIVGQGTVYIKSSGTNKTIQKSELYTFTPVTPYQDGEYTVFGELKYLGGNAASQIKVTNNPNSGSGGNGKNGEITN